MPVVKVMIYSASELHGFVYSITDREASGQLLAGIHRVSHINDSCTAAGNEAA